MKRILILLLLSTPLFSAFEKKGIGTSTVALSLSGIASQHHSFSIFNNPAQINNIVSSELFYKNYYGIKGYDLAALAFNGPLFNTPASIGIVRYGNKLYSETELAGGISYKLNPLIIIGASLNYYFVDIKNYGQSSAFGFSFSVLYSFNDQLKIAGLLSNLNEPTIGKAKEGLPVSGTIGLSYNPIDDVELLFDAYKEDYYDFFYRVGARIKVIDPINLLTGFQEKINSFSFGIELIMDDYGISYALDVHPSLSSSHAIGFNYVY